MGSVSQSYFINIAVSIYNNDYLWLCVRFTTVYCMNNKNLSPSHAGIVPGSSEY